MNSRPPTLRTDRPGVTLLEVLVAIFVMGIGLLALLTLFPLGALRMAGSIRYERAAQCCQQATAAANMKGLRNDSNITPYFKNPGGGVDAPDTGPSHPVFVDPRANLLGTKTAGANIYRAAPSYAQSTAVGPNGAAAYYQFFHLMDDITFQRGMGVPKMYGSNIERELLYTWAYMLQRPKQGDAALVNAAVCVFERRAKAAPFDTTFTGSVMDPNTNSITITYSGTVPDIGPGGWVLDATKLSNNIASGKFYRVTGVRDGPSANTLVLDLQTPLQGYSSTSNAGEVLIMDGLIEVFDIGLLR